jgi:hypothetical protein
VSKGTKIDKLDLAIRICNDLFVNLTDEEKENIKSIIEFIHQNGFIKRVSYYKLFCVGIMELFKSKKKSLIGLLFRPISNTIQNLIIPFNMPKTIIITGILLELKIEPIIITIILLFL